MPETKNWYILRTKYATETKLSSVLSRKGYETYCPRYTETQLANSGEKDPRSSVLFSSWVFIRCTTEELQTLRSSNPTIKMVYHFNEPAVVADQEISFIKHALFYYRNLQLVKAGFGVGLPLTTSTEEGMSYALPSLGFMMMTQNEIENVYHPLWTTNGILQPQTEGSFKKSPRSLLKRIPSMVGNSMLKLSTAFSRATWS